MKTVLSTKLSQGPCEALLDSQSVTFLGETGEIRIMELFS